MLMQSRNASYAAVQTDPNARLVPRCKRLSVARRGGCVRASYKGDQARQQEPGPALKAVWYAAEQFGKLVGRGGKQGEDAVASTSAPQQWDRATVVDSIREDYARNYFVSGAGEMSAYAPDCIFADPFVSFKGVQRFKQNVGNLGGMMQDVKLNIDEFKEEGNEIRTRWRFSCILSLPWGPKLAAKGSTRHVLDPSTHLVTQHIEAWDVEPGKVVAQLFRPGNTVPRSQLEIFMLSASEGDVLGMWYSVSRTAFRLTWPVVAAGLGARLITGHGLTDPLLGRLEGFCATVAGVSGITEVVKFVIGM